jgi:hypothetical protein
MVFHRDPTIQVGLAALAIIFASKSPAENPGESTLQLPREHRDNNIRSEYCQRCPPVARLIQPHYLTLCAGVPDILRASRRMVFMRPWCGKYPSRRTAAVLTQPIQRRLLKSIVCRLDTPILNAIRRPIPHWWRGKCPAFHCIYQTLSGL